MTAIDPASVFTPRPGGLDWTRWRGRWALGLMLITAALTGPIGYAGQLGYAALVGLAGIASLPLLGGKRPPIIGVGILLLLAIWCLVATTWSPAAPVHPDFHRYKALEGVTAAKLVMELALYTAFYVAARETPFGWSDRIMATLAVSLLAASVVMAIDALSGQALYKFFRLSAHAVGKAETIQSKAARGCYTVALLFWPAAVWMWRRRWRPALAVMVVGFVVAAIGLGVDAPLAATILGGVAFWAVRRFGRPAVWVFLVLTVIYFALAPMVIEQFGRFLPAPHGTEGIAKASWGARVDIWRFVAAEVAQHPFLGVGMDSSRVFPAIPLHPHNAALQLWMELGPVGAALGVLFWAWLWGRIAAEAEAQPATAGVGAAAAVAYLTIGALSFGVWQEWWLALGTIALVVHLMFGRAFLDWRQDDEPALQELQPLG